MTQPQFPIYTIGHSNHPLDAFIALLRLHGIDEVADVRSSPYNRSPYTAHFNKDALEESLAAEGVRYVYMGAELGGRPADPSCYDAGRVRYDRVARTDDFLFGIQTLLRDANERKVALMCAEKEPLDCHRTLLVAHALTAEYGLDREAMRHVLPDGRDESHADVMSRLLENPKALQYDLFAPAGGADEMAEAVERAVRQRADKVAYARRWPSVAEQPEEDAL